jgi:4-alpha-glucanotransferase
MRASGILLPISSLPSPYGIGTLGKEAFEFVDFLKKAGQSYWQVLPLGPTSYGDSPYQTFSAFAGNPYFIDLDLLAKEGLLKQNEYRHLETPNPELVDYEYQYFNRFKVLRLAYSRFNPPKESDFEKFIEDNKKWLDDYALFMSIKGLHNDQSWWLWEEKYKKRNREALEEFIETHQSDIGFWKFVQYYFFKQWLALKNYANQKGIEIIGDIPIYVAQDSSDVWSNPLDWQLDENLDPIDVAGCPPDAFAITGQLWGNPIYNYEKMEKEGFGWWIERIKESFKLYDVVRIDHFRGFEAYYAIPYGHPTAEFGRWVKGPGMKLFQRVKDVLGDVRIIAEDLGFLTPEVYQLLADTGYPGMKILQFGFDPYNDSEYLPHNYKRNSYVYTGTHDNMTVRSWFKILNEAEKAFVKAYLDFEDDEKVAEKMIKVCLASVCKVAVIPLQDYLEQGDEGRINVPSTLGGNWVWRIKSDVLTEELHQKIYSWCKTYRRARY